MKNADSAARWAVASMPPADGSETEGRKGIAYVRDHYAPAVVADLLAHLGATSS